MIAFDAIKMKEIEYLTWIDSNSVLSTLVKGNKLNEG